MEAQVRALLLCTVIISSAAEKLNLTGTVGGHVTFPDPVEEMGFILFTSKNIAMVDDRGLTIFQEKYENKLLFNKTTGLFTITDLQREESGIYSIQSIRGRVFITTYKVSVYEPVAAPAVQLLSGSSDSCSLLCGVDRAEETTLLWYRDEEMVKQNSSALSLSLTVHKQDYNSSYRCVAANPAGSKSRPVNVEEICDPHYTGGRQGNPGGDRTHVTFIIPVVAAVLILLGAFIIRQKCLHQKGTTTAAQGPGSTETDVHYSDLQFTEGRLAQQVGNSPEAPGDGRSHLKTIYDKLELCRLVPPDPADNV